MAGGGGGQGPYTHTHTRSQGKGGRCGAEVTLMDATGRVAVGDEPPPECSAYRDMHYGSGSSSSTLLGLRSCWGILLGLRSCWGILPMPNNQGSGPVGAEVQLGYL